MENSCRLVVFARAPQHGKVKTRLIPAIGPDSATRLHENLVHRVLRSTVSADRWQTELHCTPAADHPFFDTLARQYALERRTQCSGDLGQRMSAAMAAALGRAEQVVLVGADCPTLCAADIHAAFDALAAGADAVLGPAEDGGYYLIGLSRADDRLFADMSWGSDNVMDATRSRLKKIGWSWVEVTTRWDVDRPEDLKKLSLNAELRSLLPDSR